MKNNAISMCANLSKYLHFSKNSMSNPFKEVKYYKSLNSKCHKNNFKYKKEVMIIVFFKNAALKHKAKLFKIQSSLSISKVIKI